MAGTPSNDLNISQPGYVVFDGVSTFTGRTIQAGSGITISNGSGISGNTTISMSGGAAIDSIVPNSGTSPVIPDSNGNITMVGSGSTTTVGSLNTLTTQLTGLTNHALLVGAGTTTITKVGPSSTSGQVLQSAGASADPAFSTATYPSTSGTSGNVLTSNGTNWVSSPVPSNFSPASVIQISDDFTSAIVGGLAGAAAVISSALGWYTNAAGGGFGVTAATSNAHPGVISNSAFSAAYTSLYSSGNVNTIIGSYVLGGGALSVDWYFNIANLSTVTNRYTLRIGMGDVNTGTDYVNGIYVEYSDNINSGNWVYKTAAASSRTPANSSTAVTTGWHHLNISVNAAASSISFTMDGVSLGAAATATIPTAAICPLFSALRDAGTIAANTFLIDLFSLTQTLTTPR